MSKKRPCDVHDTNMMADARHFDREENLLSGGDHLFHSDCRLAAFRVARHAYGSS
jgi:hypothetical protein